MRWTALFADLEAELGAAQAAEVEAEVRERSRAEAAQVRLADRLRAARGVTLSLRVAGVGDVAGRCAAAGPDWLVVEEPSGAEVLVPLPALLAVTGLGPWSAPAPGVVAQRLDFGYALGEISRRRTPVVLRLRDGSSLPGTVDRVGADFVDVAVHPVDEPRRSDAVQQVRTVPVGSITLLRAG